MTQRFVCVHGHFYQPPRENPWTGKIERQPSADPHYDWNERITNECYRPNGAARILDERGEVRKTVNNYARMSFNFGPTLLSYLESEAGDVYRAILDADRESLRQHDGHGSAMAQAYNHTILPLAGREDKLLQVSWGVRDFEHRFGRKPEGLWLPETAVDVETLEVLAECGIRFTVLAPQQAAQVRGPDGDWSIVPPGQVDTTIAHECPLPSGNSVALFFYDGALASAVAFQNLLDDGKNLVERMLTAAVEPDGGRLVHYAIDGETYGHHRKFGEMALAFALDSMASDESVTLTNYAEFLALHPPTQQVRIVERSSWSCSHGVERWGANCDCGAVAEHPGWTREWRAVLRSTFDWLGDRLATVYEERAGRLVADARNLLHGYIDVMLDPSAESRAEFLGRYRADRLSDPERAELWQLLEMQRFAQLMFTSCGWFFEDVSRIESAQVLRYAARAVELAREATGIDLADELLERLDRARCNHADQGTARDVYLRGLAP